MIHRAHNFSAGPCILPVEVLQQAQAEFVEYQESGMSLIEMSHRSKHYDAIHNETMSLAKTLFATPDEFEVLFIQGGATLQFAMVPMNLLTTGQRAGYVNSGAWGKGAIIDGALHGDIYTAWDGADCHYTRMPQNGEIELQKNTRYLHITSNETIGGVRFPHWPDVAVPLVCDMSSDYLSRPIPWQKFDLVYGGAQKNLGPAGMAIVFIRKSILANTNHKIARYLRYDIHEAKQSLFNTPPVFAIYMVGKVLNWMQAQGGLLAIEEGARQKAALLYDVIDQSGDYYTCPVDKDCRSHMNVVFRLPDEALEKRFINEATDADLLNLKGHRSVGGCRASIYNAMPKESVAVLAQFMQDFINTNG